MNKKKTRAHTHKTHSQANVVIHIQGNGIEKAWKLRDTDKINGILFSNSIRFGSGQARVWRHVKQWWVFGQIRCWICWYHSLVRWPFRLCKTIGSRVSIYLCWYGNNLVDQIVFNHIIFGSSLRVFVCFLVFSAFIDSFLLCRFFFSICQRFLPQWWPCFPTRL